MVYWAAIEEAVLSRFDCVREIRAMCVKSWEAKRRPVFRAIPGPEPTMRRILTGMVVTGGALIILDSRVREFESVTELLLFKYQG